MALSVREIVECLISEPGKRVEVWALAMDSGLGRGMQIEKWLLIEMLAQLIALKREGVISSAEGEHKYPLIKTSRYEHCDLWWILGGREHWLEVKTIVLTEMQARGSIDDIKLDLEKPFRLRKADVFHHLAVIFPLASDHLSSWRRTLDPMYTTAELFFQGHWLFPLWKGAQLAMFLYSES